MVTIVQICVLLDQGGLFMSSHASESLWLDYCNVLYVGLLLVQNAMAWVIYLLIIYLYIRLLTLKLCTAHNSYSKLIEQSKQKPIKAMDVSQYVHVLTLLCELH